MTRRLASVAVSPAAAWEARRDLFRELAPALPIRLVPEPSPAGDDAVVIFGASPESLEASGRAGIPAFASIETAGRTRVSGVLTFTESPRLDPKLRGVEVTVTDLEVTPVPVRNDGEVLATIGRTPVWAQTSLGNGTLDLVGLEPTLPPTWSQPTWIQDPDHVVSAIPLVHFLRRLGSEATPATPIRACFLIDDPNLRWWSYGFVGYRAMVEHARELGYHTSISMIPLDMRWYHPRVAAFFRRHADELSLSIQGNNHTRGELASTSADTMLRSAAEALRRVDRFERKSGLEVDRVVVAPHGRLSAEGLYAQAEMGLEAIALSPWSLPSIAPKDGPSVDVNLSRLGPNGMALLIRRHLLSEPGWLAIHAYLGQSLVVYLHHEDLSGGLDVLERAVERIGAVGPVRWGPLRDVARSRFTVSVDEGMTDVRMYAPVVDVPVSTEAVRVTHPGTSAEVPLLVEAGDASQVVRQDDVVPVSRPGVIRIGLLRDIPSAEAIATPARSAWPMIRRVLTEGRDRAWPMVPRKRR